MMRLLPSVPILFASLLWHALAKGQDIPAGVPTTGVGFQLPTIGGSLQYSFSTSESATFGFYGGGPSLSTNFGGNVAFITRSEKHPFSAIYSGGALVTNSQQPTSFYQNLAFSQVLNFKRWMIVVADSPSYLPESPTSGLSGIPGVGDVGVDPVSGGSAAEPGILTTYGPRFANSASGTVSRSFTHGLSANLSASYSLLHFFGDNASVAVNSASESGSIGLSYRLNARNDLNMGYNLSGSTFSGAPAVISQGFNVGYSREWTRRFSTSVSGGPARTSSSGPLSAAAAMQFSAGASASYAGRRINYGLSYSRGISNGNGVIAGAFSDSVSFSAHRQFSRYWNVSASASYGHSTSLPIFNTVSFSSQSGSANAQVSRGFRRQFSSFASYSLSKQFVQTTLGAQNAFNGVYQTFSFGMSYSPRTLRFGR